MKNRRNTVPWEDRGSQPMDTAPLLEFKMPKATHTQQ